MKMFLSFNLTFIFIIPLLTLSKEVVGNDVEFQKIYSASMKSHEIFECSDCPAVEHLGKDVLKVIDSIDTDNENILQAKLDAKIGIIKNEFLNDEIDSCNKGYTIFSDDGLGRDPISVDNQKVIRELSLVKDLNQLITHDKHSKIINSYQKISDDNEKMYIVTNIKEGSVVFEVFAKANDLEDVKPVFYETSKNINNLSILSKNGQRHLAFNVQSNTNSRSVEVPIHNILGNVNLKNPVNLKVNIINLESMKLANFSLNAADTTLSANIANTPTGELRNLETSYNFNSDNEKSFKVAAEVGMINGEKSKTDVLGAKIQTHSGSTYSYSESSNKFAKTQTFKYAQKNGDSISYDRNDSSENIQVTKVVNPLNKTTIGLQHKLSKLTDENLIGASVSRKLNSFVTGDAQVNFKEDELNSVNLRLTFRFQ